MPGGANEHWNAESGQVWLERARVQWPETLWINPSPRRFWEHTHSVGMIADILGRERMVPMTIEGLTAGMRLLGA